MAAERRVARLLELARSTVTFGRLSLGCSSLQGATAATQGAFYTTFAAWKMTWVLIIR